QHYETIKTDKFIEYYELFWDNEIHNKEEIFPEIFGIIAAEPPNSRERFVEQTVEFYENRVFDATQLVRLFSAVQKIKEKRRISAFELVVDLVEWSNCFSQFSYVPLLEQMATVPDKKWRLFMQKVRLMEEEQFLGVYEISEIIRGLK
ncbi:MAG: hypothetical protein ACPGXY_05345, partial [Alphaproteobacteria bacterium]